MTSISTIAPASTSLSTTLGASAPLSPSPSFPSLPSSPTTTPNVRSLVARLETATLTRHRSPMALHPVEAVASAALSSGLRRCRQLHHSPRHPKQVLCHGHRHRLLPLLASVLPLLHLLPRPGRLRVRCLCIGHLINYELELQCKTLLEDNAGGAPVRSSASSNDLLENCNTICNAGESCSSVSSVREGCSNVVEIYNNVGEICSDVCKFAVLEIVATMLMAVDGKATIRNRQRWL
ncbi:hypothetical protein C4D60_Mb09t17480 [Musa balbisiana]|uniref:Uncharacterized protein n=1 Tax=Musa balbisiana TaxID=52838 RepID=A0A4V4H3B5_MUSBA|nr:hypothetical protein C4D60_Mb09t17480 [Musa balbisiana]